MRLRLKLCLATLILQSILLSACVAGVTSPPEPTPTPPPLIDLTVKDLQGEPASLRDLRGEVVLVNFWASWCSPCREEMPLLQTFYQAHHSKGFTVLAINVSEDPEEAAAFIEEQAYTFPVWSDPPGNTMIELHLNGLPASLLLDAEGRLQHVWLGPLTQEMLDESVLPLLKD